MTEVEIASSARKHQGRDRFTDADVLHAIRYPRLTGIGTDDATGETLMYVVGPTTSGALDLEVIIARPSTDDQTVIHVMKLTDKFPPPR